MITASRFAHIAPLPPPLPAPSADSASPLESLSRSRRNVGEPSKYWPQHSTLKIAMYEYAMDDPYVLAVKKAASEWLPHINLKFEFVSGEEGDVRITQNQMGRSGGSSDIGTDAQNTPYAPSMSLPANHTNASFAHTVLHEFGHMLGAHHAHQHPDADIPWDRAGLARRFTKEMLEDNFHALPRNATYDFLPYDGDSAMHYSLDPGWTTNNSFHARNSMLSAGDIAWANKAYPKDPT